MRGAGQASGRGGAPAAQTASLAAVLVVLPGMLALLQFASSRTDLKMLLFPPLAAIGYQVLRSPHNPLAHLRSVVLAPTLASLFGTGLARAATLRGGALRARRRATAPPPVAVAPPPLFSAPRSWIYPPSVLLGTTALSGVSRAWRRFYARLSATPGRGGPAGSG